MNKKGFTLIELLAVVVILAIIALIATPIILGIIGETKEDSELRSADFYLDALELSVSKAILKEEDFKEGDYPILSNGNICLTKETTIETCTNPLEVRVKGDAPKSGTITVKTGEVTDVSLYFNDKEIVKNDKGKLEYVKTLEDICELKDGEELAIGSKYECDVGNDKKSFYVLEVGINPVENSILAENEVALILEGNYDEETLSWCDPDGENPMDSKCAASGLTKKLNEISNNWTNLQKKQIVIPSIEQVATADSQTVVWYGFAISDENNWIYNWPGNEDYNEGNIQQLGYWTSSPHSQYSNAVWFMAHESTVDCVDVYNADEFGVRPVIILKFKNY